MTRVFTGAVFFFFLGMTPARNVPSFPIASKSCFQTCDNGWLKSECFEEHACIQHS